MVVRAAKKRKPSARKGVKGIPKGAVKDMLKRMRPKESESEFTRDDRRAKKGKKSF